MQAAVEIQPTRVRWRIAGLLLIVVTLTFIDRFNMNVAAKYIQQEFGLTNLQIGSLLSAFVLGYAVLQTPGGWLGDRLGARIVLLVSIVWWSVFTALTAWAPNLPLAQWIGIPAAFWLVRFAIGLGEAPALPNVNKILGRWMTPGERARGNSLILAGVGVGGTFTPPAIAWIMTNWGWRLSFVACGALGLLIAALWHWNSTERPEDHPGVNAAELSLITTGRPKAKKLPTPWARMFRGANLPALMLSNFLVGYVMYIFYTWFFLYLVNVRHFAVMSGSYWSTAPFVAILIAAPLGGHFSDLMLLRFGHPWGRRIPVLACTVLCGLLIISGSRIDNPYAAIVLFALAAGSNCVTAVSQWTLPNYISEHHAGSLAGVLNTTTNLGGALSPVLTPYIAARWGWIAAFDVAAGLMVVVFALWFLIHPERRID